MNITPNEIEVQIGDSVFLGHFAAEYDRDMIFLNLNQISSPMCCHKYIPSFGSFL